MDFLKGDALLEAKRDSSSQWAVRFLVGLTLFRLLYHLFQPIGLMGDESYYWDWSRHLDWGYYSKPPMIAWLYGLGHFLGGGVGHVVVFKAMATLISSGRLTFMFMAVRRLFGAQVAMWATIMVGVSCADLGLSALLTPDNPMLLAWFAAFYALVRLTDVEEANGSKAKWLYLVIFFALGFGVLSKQMVFVLMGLFVVWAIIGARHLLKKPLFYLAVAGSNVWLTPSLIWNANHGNATADHTAHHFESAKMDALSILNRFLEFVGQELLLIGFILFPIMLFLCVRYFKSFKELKLNEKMVLTFCVPVLLVMMGMMFRQRINANWPVAFLLMGMVGATVVLVRSKPGLLKWSLGLNAFFTVLLMVLIPTHWVKIQQRDWKAWRPMTASIKEKVEQAGYNEETDFMLTCHERYYASQLSFYMKGQPQFYYWPGSFDAEGVADQIEHQYSFWHGPSASEKSRAFIFVPKDKGFPESMRAYFTSIEKIGRETFTWKAILSNKSPKEVRSVDLYLAEGYQGWPLSKFSN